MNLGFFGPKMAVSWRICFFFQKIAETPIFIVFLGCALFGRSCQKRDILDTHTKRRKFSLIIEKLIFKYFLFFLVFFLSLFFFFFVLLFFVFLFGGFKGHVRWPKGPPHLALNPPYLFFCFCFVFVFVFVLFCFLFVFVLFLFCFCFVFVFLFEGF